MSFKENSKQYETWQQCDYRTQIDKDKLGDMLTPLKLVGVLQHILIGIYIYFLQYLTEYLCNIVGRCLVQTEKGRMNSQAAKS